MIDYNKLQEYYRNAPYSNNKKQVMVFVNEIFCICPLNTNYMISNMGRVASRIHGTICTPKLDYKGFNKIRTKQGDFEVARAVAIAFLDNHSSFFNQRIIHKNGLNTDDVYINLEWAPFSPNDDYKDKSYAWGENSHFAKHNNIQIHSICKLIEQNYSINDIIKIEGMPNTKESYNYIFSIYNRRHIWKNISSKYDFSKNTKIRSNKRESEQFKNNICRLVLNGETPKQIASKLNIEYKHSIVQKVSNIKNGRLYRNIYLKLKEGNNND